MIGYILITLALALIIIASILINIDLYQEAESEFELARRGNDGDRQAKKKAWALKHVDEVSLAYKITFFALQLLGIFLLSLKAHFAFGLIISAVTFLLVRYIFVNSTSDKGFNLKNFSHNYAINKSKKLVRSLKAIIKPLRNKNSKKKVSTKNQIEDDQQEDAVVQKRSFYSEQEFKHNFVQDSEVLSEQLRLKIERLLTAPQTKLKAIMVNISSIPKVDINLTLTPVIYDELHQKGYDMALVFQGAEDNLVGLIYLPGSDAVENMASASNQSSSLRVGDRMEQGLQYIPDSSNLEDLIAGFAQGGHNAVLITSSSGQVSGVLTARHLLNYLNGS